MTTDLSSLVFEKLAFKLSSHQIDAFATFEKELLEWNEKFNLTAIRDSDGIRTKHFLDSLTCLIEMKSNPPAKLIDVGTGAGFPGIPLKIIYPSMKLTLVESVGKKTGFCRHMVDKLSLSNVEILTLRVEEVGQLREHREKYDWAVARAVASMPILLEYLLPLVRVGGAILAQKGESAHSEAQTAEKASRVLGGRLKHVTPITLPGVVEERFLVVYDKIAATPPQYPRRVGQPTKSPL